MTMYVYRIQKRHYNSGYMNGICGQRRTWCRLYYTRYFLSEKKQTQNQMNLDYTRTFRSCMSD